MKSARRFPREEVSLPKEVILRLVSVPPSGVPMSGGALTGVSSVDNVLRAHNVKSVEPAIRVSGQGAGSAELLRLFRVIVESEADLAALVSELRNNPYVDSVSPRHAFRTMGSAF